MVQDTEFELFAQAVAASSLISPEDYSSAALAAGHDVERLRELLITRGLLTHFQAEAVAEGRAGSLRVGNYDLLDRLGAGGMGAVYKARHRRMKRLVALKILAPNLSTNPVFVKRFQREVETIACLGHPNVVMAYDSDEADAGHFLVMEFVNGRDLAAYVAQEGPLPLPRAIDFMLQAARGLAYAHSQDIIHRDVKPHNLLVSEQGVVKVTDLGLARLQHEADGSVARSDVTAAGVIVGTADFMPPEQAFDPDAIDSRADIYSLGCTLYYLLAGKPPYTASSVFAILMCHRDAAIPSLAAICPDTPARLETLFQRMLAKRPADRIAQMSEVVSELEEIAREMGIDPSATSNTASVAPSSRQGASLGSAAPVNTTILGSDATAPIGLQTVELSLPATPASRPASGSPARVLVVEPSRVQASIIKSYLQENSHAVVATVGTGREAIDAIRRLSPQVVVSTMHLSDWNGVQLAEQIRAEIRPSPPGFVLVTTEALPDEVDSTCGLQRVVLLRKPFNASQLNEALSKVSSATQEIALPSSAAAPLDPNVTGEMPRPVGLRAGLRVLVVDDSATARANVRTVLRSLGITQCVEATDGAYAIAVAAREICDLIITDYNMPLMDGRALVSYLKQNPATSTIPIVMVTTETEPRILDPVRRLGVVAILEKSFPASVVGPLLASLFG
jgi:serine/threonine protein kinase